MFIHETKKLYTIVLKYYLIELCKYLTILTVKFIILLCNSLSKLIYRGDTVVPIQYREMQIRKSLFVTFNNI